MKLMEFVLNNHFLFFLTGIALWLINGFYVSYLKVSMSSESFDKKLIETYVDLKRRGVIH